jgi:hypothetical protein
VRKLIGIFIVGLFLILLSSNQCDKCPKEIIGAIENEKQAIKFAKRNLKARYGRRVNRRKPFLASMLNDTIWEVKGTMPKGLKGGNPYIEFNAKTREVYLMRFDK